MKTLDKNDIPKLVGNRFVKEFTNYLLEIIRSEKITQLDITKKAFIEKNIKPTTTSRYLTDLLFMEIIEIKEDGIIEVI